MKAFLLILFVVLSSIANGQSISMSDKGVVKLKKIIARDQQTRMVFKEWVDLAKTALNELPNPVDTIASEGYLISHPKKQRTLKSFADIRKIYALAISYRITGDKLYLEKGVEFLTAWAEVNQPTGNPINDTKLELVIEAYDLIKNKMDKGRREKVEQWLRRVADQEIKNFNGKYNNWNSHRLKIITQIAFLLNDQDYIKYAKDDMATQILNNLYPDGSSLDFKHRDALHYHTYTLEPLLKAALIIKNATGLDYFTYISSSGSSIKKSVDFLAVYARGEKKHAEFVNSKVKIDRDRAAQKEPGFEIGGDFKVVKAIDVFAYATCFDRAYQPVHQLLTKEEPLASAGPVIIELKPYSEWIPILNQVR